MPLTRRIFWSGDGRLARGALLEPQAATTNSPADASATARTRVPTCIRVLPLRLNPAAFFPELRGESAPASRSYSTASSADQILLPVRWECQVHHGLGS